ncbi:MAG: dephospho-CoA kinase [Thermodesulfobacteriota bacterium]
MLVVGLTGGIASGKSTVSAVIREAGIPVICLDELSRQAVSAGSTCLEAIRRVFGDAVLDSEGALDRKAVADMVFSDSARRKALEAIIHPWVSEETGRLLARFAAEGMRVAVVDIPLLYEVGWEDMFDLVMLVYVPQDVQEQRLVARDRISREDARARLDAQRPIDEKKALADIVIDNSGTVQSTREQVSRALDSILRTQEQTS